MRLKNISGIYSITCKIDGRIYIGSSKNISHRCSYHRYELRHNKHKNQYLQNAWNKYGEENFEFCIVEIVAIESLLIREKEYILKFDSCNRSNGFNLQKEPGCGPGLTGAQNGMYGKTHTKEVKKILSECAKKRIGELNPNYGNGLNIRGERNPFYGKRHSEETKRKISEGCKSTKAKGLRG